MSYLSEVLADSPAALWLFNEGSGTVAEVYNRAEAATRDGSYLGGPTLGVSGLTGTGTAVQTGASSYVRVEPPRDSMGANYSFEVVFEDVGGSIPLSDSDGTWVLDLSGTHPVLLIETVSHTVTSVLSADLVTGRHHLAVTAASVGVNLSLYIDGVPVDAWVGDASRSTLGGYFYFGRDAAGNYAPTTFAAAAFYASTLSAARVAAHYAVIDESLLVPVSVTVAPQPLTIQQDVQTLPPLTVVVAPQAIPPSPVIYGTRFTADGGLRLASTSTATWDPPVDESPTVLPERVIAASVIDSVTIDGTNFTPNQRDEDRPRAHFRVLVGGKDVTYFRGVQTPFPNYGLESPLLYGSGMLSLPQIHAAYERPGHGALTWLTKFATVRVQRVDPDDGHVIATDYVGFVSSFDHSGRDFSCVLGGQATGRAAMQDRPAPIFPLTTDIGTQVQQTIQHSLRLPISNTPTTGIEVPETGGSGSHLDWLADVLAKSTEVDGVQWTVGVDSNGAYRMHRKDLTTIGATVYVDGFRVVESLKRDFSEEPNRVWASGIDKDGQRQRFAIFPGLAQSGRPPFPGTLSPGDSGDGVTALIWRLYGVGYIDATPFGMEWTTATHDDVTDAVKDLQDDAGLSQTGVVNSATWTALFDPDVTGYSLTGSAIRPAAQKSYTKAFLRNASGQTIGLNPNYDRTRPMVDASVDMGYGWTRRRMKRWAQHEMADDNTSNWVGTITVNTGGVIDGEHNPGDPFDSSLVRDVRTLRPGMNLWLPNWDGGTLVHVSGVNVSDDSCELTVDTRARDTMKVWEVIRRNRESRRSPARQWIAQNRRSSIRDDTGAFYDGGTFGRVQRTFLPGDRWTVIKVPAGRSGQIGKIDISLRDSRALFVVAAFGKQIGRERLSNLIGNPLTKAGTKQWQHKNRTLVDDHWLTWAMGGVDGSGNSQPCGYWPEHVDPSAYNSHSRTGGSADASSDLITLPGHGFGNGDEVFFAGGVPDGLTPDNNYYVVDAGSNTFKVSASQGGSPMNITGDSSGVVVQTRTRDFPPVTGDFRDEAGVPYYCVGSPVLWVAFYPDRDCFLQGGRIFELQLDDAAG